MRIGLLTSIWRRPALTEAVLRYYAGLDVPDIEFVRIAVRSPEDPDPAARVDRWVYVDAPNMPLTDKWNHGAVAVALFGVDCVVITGSDDILNAAYFEVIRDLMDDGADYIKLGGLHFYDAPTNRLIYVENCFAGLGRCLSWKLLRMVDFQPYREGYPKGIDGRMDERCFPLVRDTTVRIRNSRDRGIFACDVKLGQNIHSFEDVRSKYASELIECDPEEMRKYLPEFVPSIDELERTGEPRLEAAPASQRDQTGRPDAAHCEGGGADVRHPEVQG